MIEFSDEQVESYVESLDTNYRQKLRRDVLSFMDEKDADEAEDIVQEVFCRAAQIVMTKKMPFSNEYWYLRISAKNLYIKKAQAKVRYPLVRSDTVEEDIIDPREQPEQCMESREHLESVTDQIQAIPQASIRMVMDRLSKGESIQEISDALHIGKSTVNSHIYMGRRFLRQSPMMGKQDEMASTKERDNGL